MLTEIHMSDEHPVDILNFSCIVNYRSQFPAAGVAIYHNVQDTTQIVSSNMDIHIRNTPAFGFNVSEIGEICVAQCKSENEHIILMVAVYISPKNKIQDIIQFLHRNLLIYTAEGSALINENLYKIPMILSGDFNTNFADDSSQPLIDFLYNKLGLTMSNNRNISTTRYGTTIDAVFSRYLDRFHSKIFVSYFSYHKPIVSFLEYNDTISSPNIVEIQDSNSNVNNSNLNNQINEKIHENNV